MDKIKTVLIIYKRTLICSYIALITLQNDPYPAVSTTVCILQRPVVSLIISAFSSILFQLIAK